MRIKIEKNGHQHYSEVTGDVIEWTQTVEMFFKDKFLQVPAVILKTEDGIVIYSLKQYLYNISIETL